MSRHVPVVLEAADRDGVRVVLTQHNWQSHQRRHMEIRGHLEEIKVAIEEPDVIVVDDTGCYRYYKLGAIGGRFRGLYLQVLVRYSEEPQGKVGIIVSAFCSRVIAQGELRWIRGITR